MSIASATAKTSSSPASWSTSKKRAFTRAIRAVRFRPIACPARSSQEIREATIAMAKHLRVIGLMNVQFAVKREDGKPVVYVLEVNPRASRTVPFVAKATGVPLAKIAAKVMAGMTLPELGLTREPIPAHVSVKESVFPFRKFAGVDIVLGPEMRSTGEVMGVSERFSIAFAKAQLAAGTVLPTEGKIFLSVSRRDKDAVVDLARRLVALGHEIVATEGTGQRLEDGGHRTSSASASSPKAGPTCSTS